LGLVLQQDQPQPVLTPRRDSLVDQAARLAAGDATSVELVTASLERLARFEPTLNAFRLTRAEAAIEEARQADRRLAAGERSPLLGVPVAIKDDTDLAGEPTAFGCEGAPAIKTADHEAVARLRASGAVIVGKTNTPELGQWPFTEGPAFGATRNPWQPAYSPGGSSGGSAAAVAAGVVAGALGSDGAGSIRIPAAWTHLIGIKPQRGRISSWPDPEAFNGLTSIGPLAARVADAALLLDAVSGNRDGDLHRPPTPLEPFVKAAGRDPGRLRIAVSLRVPFSGTITRPEPEVRAAVGRLADRLASLGHEVDEADPDYRLMGFGFLARSLPALDDWSRRVPDPGRLDGRTQENVRSGRRLGGAPLRLARRLEGRQQRRVGAIFDHHDLVLVPTTAGLPTPIGAYDGLSNWATDQQMASRCPYTWPWNVLGWPAMNVPAGLTPTGLPLGAQLLGPVNSEALLISLAAQLEDAERWYERTPPGDFGDYPTPC
jgi:amidase